jgi:predicted NBD/HSP70 family sugar kinase
MNRCIGIDLGGTRIKAGLVVNERLALERVVDVESKSPSAIIAQLERIVLELDPPSDERRAPVGLAAAGVLDAAAGVVRESPNFPE